MRSGSVHLPILYNYFFLYSSFLQRIGSWSMRLWTKMVLLLRYLTSPLQVELLRFICEIYVIWSFTFGSLTLIFNCFEYCGHFNLFFAVLVLWTFFSKCVSFISFIIFLSSNCENTINIKVSIPTPCLVVLCSLILWYWLCVLSSSYSMNLPLGKKKLWEH